MGGFMKYARCHDIHTNFHKDWFRHLKVDDKGDSQTQQDEERISILLLFFSE
jgi:hypothetical protein